MPIWAIALTALAAAAVLILLGTIAIVRFKRRHSTVGNQRRSSYSAAQHGRLSAFGTRFSAMLGSGAKAGTASASAPVGSGGMRSASNSAAAPAAVAIAIDAGGAHPGAWATTTAGKQAAGKHVVSASRSLQRDEGDTLEAEAAAGSAAGLLGQLVDVDEEGCVPGQARSEGGEKSGHGGKLE